MEMRVLVSVDMEGIAGVVHGEEVIPGHSEYERNRKLLTAEANAAVRGIYTYDAAAQVQVTEAHASFRNLLPDLLDRRVELLRGTPKPGGMMAGLAEDTDAVLFIGYHGKAGTPRSVMAHTISGGTVADVRCNGRSLGELGLNTALAAHYGAPPRAGKRRRHRGNRGGRGSAGHSLDSGQTRAGCSLGGDAASR